MRASEQFRIYVNSPIPYVVNFFSRHYLGDAPYKQLSKYVKEIKTGKTPSKKIKRYWDKEEYPWFRPEDIGFDIYLEDSSAKISSLALKEKQATIHKAGTLLITAIGDIGRLGILKKEASSNQQITGILFKEEMLPEYAYFSLMAINNIICEKSSSTTLSILNQKKILAIELKAPNIEIQGEFVRFLKYLFKCLRHKELPSKKDFNLDGNLIEFAIKAFETYYSQNILTSLHFECQEYIQNLRQAILQEAVSGKLVPQNPNDEPASRLLKKIRKEKENVFKKKSSKKMDSDALKNTPYDIPENWIWCYLGDIGLLQRGKSKHRPRNDPSLFINGKYPLVQTGDISKAKFQNGLVKTYTSKYNEHGLRQSKLWPKGTLCITIAANIAETGFLDFEACFPDSVVAFVPFIDQTIARYVKLFIDLTKSNIEEFAPSTAQKNINLGILNTLLFPLPPLAEQNRILAKVHKLMKRCDELEEKISDNQKNSELLMEAVLKEAFVS